MNKKAEMNYAGIIVITAIALIIGASLIGTLGQYTGQMTNKYNSSDYQFLTPANGATKDMVGQTLLSTPIVTNKTDGVIIAPSNYTIASGVSSTTGVKTIQYTSNAATYAAKNVNVTYEYGAFGYADDAGSRAIIPLIIVFFALLIMVIAITPVFRQGFLEIVGAR